MPRSPLIPAALIGAVLFVATSAQAGPCERLLGARWLIYFEKMGADGPHTTAGTIDFTSPPGVQGAPAYVVWAPSQRPGGPPAPAGMGYSHGSAELRSASCLNLAEPLAAANVGAAGLVVFSVAADGQTSVIQTSAGVQIGYAERLPPPPVTPQRRR